MTLADRNIEVLNVPDPNTGEFGAHGVGEIGASGVPPATGVAIFNATSHRSARFPTRRTS